MEDKERENQRGSSDFGCPPARVWSNRFYESRPAFVLVMKISFCSYENTPGFTHASTP